MVLPTRVRSLIVAEHHDENIVQANGIEICTDAYGNPEDPAVLLIMGASASMLLWEENFCQRLADGGHFVIRLTTAIPAGRKRC